MNDFPMWIIKGNRTWSAATRARFRPSRSFGPVYVFGKPNLETNDEVAILFRDLDGELGITVAEVFQFAHVGRAARDHADANNVEQGAYTRGGLRDDEFSKSGKGESSGSTRVDRGGDAPPYTIGVRLNSVRSNVRKHVCVQVNESGRNNFAGGIDHLARQPGGNVTFQARDFTVANGHIADSLKIL